MGRSGHVVRKFLPPQHGAWAMLLLPYLAGVLSAGWRWWDLPLLGAWLSGYLLSYFALQAVKTRRPGKFREQLTWYGAVTAAFALPVLVACPRLLLFAPAYGALIGVNCWYAYRRRERALVNDLVSVVQSCLMVLVVAVVADAPLSGALVPFLVTLLYFTGTVLYVKTMIRERGNRAYLVASVAFHVVALGAVAPFGLLSAVVFAALLARAWVLPGHPLTPRQVGLAEIVASALVLVVAVG